jgi:hypothetical protein
MTLGHIIAKITLDTTVECFSQVTMTYVHSSFESWLSMKQPADVTAGVVAWRTPLEFQRTQRDGNALLLLMLLLFIPFSQVFPGTFPLELMLNPTTQASSFWL